MLYSLKTFNFYFIRGTDEAKDEISWLIELMKANKDGEVKDVAARIASLMDKQTADTSTRTPIELSSDSSVKVIS